MSLTPRACILLQPPYCVRKIKNETEYITKSNKKLARGLQDVGGHAFDTHRASRCGLLIVTKRNYRNNEFLVTIVILAILVMFVTSSSMSEPTDKNELDQESLTVDDHNHEAEDDEPVSSSLLSIGLRRFLAQKKTCNKYPKVCRAKGSAGPDCCKKKCVNVRTDQQNCGYCGHKCKYSQACCKGKCTNLATDRKNCGSCGKKCSKGKTCSSGLCSYA